MAKITWSGSWGFSLREVYATMLFFGTSYRQTKKLFVVNYDESGSERDEFRGTSFKYKEGIPVSGTIKSYKTYDEGVKIGSIDGIKLSMKSLIKAALTLDPSDDARLFRKMLSGKDDIRGGSADDTLQGFGGKDKITGGIGADSLYGGSSADRFVFKKTYDSTVALEGQDTIFDFSSRQKDKIDLKSMDANITKSGNQTFSFIGLKEFSGKAGQLRYVKEADGVHVYGDVNGDREADFSIFLKDVSKVSKGDFFL